MPLTPTQTGVLKGIVIGMSIALCIVLLGAYANPFNYTASLTVIDSLHIAVTACLIPAAFLGVCIVRLAKHRFFTPEDIDGGGLSRGSERALLLQSLLQNTMEQTLLAMLVYCAWSVIMPATYLSVVPLAALAFGVGRVLFLIGYTKGAPGRAIGFTLSFYPAMLMLAWMIGRLIWQQIKSL